MLNSAIKPKEKVHGLENGFNLPKHLAEHIYMFTGDSINVRFKAKRYIINDIIDWFGTGVRFSDVTDEWLTVDVEVNETAMYKWALQYAEHVVVLSPKPLRDNVYDGLKYSLKNYIEEE